MPMNKTSIRFALLLAAGLTHWTLAASKYGVFLRKDGAETL